MLELKWSIFYPWSVLILIGLDILPESFEVHISGHQSLSYSVTSYSIKDFILFHPDWSDLETAISVQSIYLQLRNLVARNCRAKLSNCLLLDPAVVRC